MIYYGYNTQKDPPAPFVRVTLRHPRTGNELRDLPAQLDTGADCSLIPVKIAEGLGLDFSGHWNIVGVGGTSEIMTLYSVSILIHNLPECVIEVPTHANEPWIILGRDVLNSIRLLLDGPNLKLEIG